MRTLLLIFTLSVLCFGQIGATSNKVKLADSIGSFIGSTIIEGKKALDVKIRDTIRIRDSAKVYAKITDSIKGYMKITDSVKCYAKITDSIRGYAKITDSIKGYAKITDTVRVRGMIDTVIHIKDTIKIRNVDTPVVSVNLVYTDDHPVCFFGSCVNPPSTKTTDTTIDLWPQNSPYIFPTAQAAVVCSSSSRLDSLGLTGIDSVLIEYLDNTYTEKTTISPVRGLRPCTTTVSDIFRINHFHARHIGATSTTYRAQGNIYVRKLDSLTPIYDVINAGYTHGRTAKHTVPKGKTLYITSISMCVGGTSVNAGQAGTIILRATYDRENNLNLTPGLFYIPHFQAFVVNQAYNKNFEIPLNFPEGTDIKLSIQSIASNAVFECYINGTLR